MSIGGLARGRIGNAETDEEGIAQLHLLQTREVGLAGSAKRGLCARDGSRAHGVDETIGRRVDFAYARLGRLGRDEEDKRKPVALGRGAKLTLIDLKWQVGDDETVDAAG